MRFNKIPDNFHSNRHSRTTESITPTQYRINNSQLQKDKTGTAKKKLVQI